MGRTKLELEAPRGFRLKTVVFSHGWFELPPFDWNEKGATLSGVARCGGLPAAVAIVQPSRRVIAVRAEVKGRWSQGRLRDLRAAVGGMLGLSANLDGFYDLAGDRFDWARRIGAGRMLRAASAFEDAVKMMATTNCSWSLTRQMVSRLTTLLGDPAPSGGFAFPTPEAMARQPEVFYREQVRAGYRSPYFKEFAERVADGECDPETWVRSTCSTDDLVRQMRQVRGLGRYATENLCKLFGRFDGLGLDSWCIKKYAQLFGPIDTDVAQAIERAYAPFGCWRGLALWLELTRDWHNRETPEDQSTKLTQRF